MEAGGRVSIEQNAYGWMPIPRTAKFQTQTDGRTDLMKLDPYVVRVSAQGADSGEGTAR